MLIISLTVTGLASKLLPNRSIASTLPYPFIPYNLLHYVVRTESRCSVKI